MDFSHRRGLLTTTEDSFALTQVGNPPPGEGEYTNANAGLDDVDTRSVRSIRSIKSGASTSSSTLDIGAETERAALMAKAAKLKNMPLRSRNKC